MRAETEFLAGRPEVGLQCLRQALAAAFGPHRGSMGDFVAWMILDQAVRLLEEYGFNFSASVVLNHKVRLITRPELRYSVPLWDGGPKGQAKIAEKAAELCLSPAVPTEPNLYAEVLRLLDGVNEVLRTEAERHVARWADNPHPYKSTFVREGLTRGVWDLHDEDRKGILILLAVNSHREIVEEAEIDVGDLSKRSADWEATRKRLWQRLDEEDPN